MSGLFPAGEAARAGEAVDSTTRRIARAVTPCDHVSHPGEVQMQIRVGYELVYDCPKATPMILVLNIHYTRMSDVIRPDHMITTPAIPIASYRDSYGNWCTRLVAPPARCRSPPNPLSKTTANRATADPCPPHHPI